MIPIEDLTDVTLAIDDTDEYDEDDEEDLTDVTQVSDDQGLTGTRYPTRPDNFWQYPIHTRFIFRIIGYFGYRVFHLFWPDVPVTL